MESIVGLKECEEAEKGCALRARDASVALLGESETVSGIGPPDMCILDKASTSYLSTEVTVITSFHYVLGLKVEGGASIAAYFAKLTRNQEQAQFLRSIVQTQSWKIAGGVYCCYDVFSGCDVRCQIKIPGGVSIRAVTGNGEEMEVDDTIWKGVLVSSFLRTTMLHPNLSTEIPNIFVLPSNERFPSSLQDEKVLLSSVRHLVQEGKIKLARDRLHYDKAKGSISEHVDIVSLTLLNHFVHVQRVSILQNVFHKMAADSDDPILAIYETSCMRYLGKHEEALQYLQHTLALAEQEVTDVEDYGEVFAPLYTCIAEVCVDLFQMEANGKDTLAFGLESALRATQLDPCYRPARIILARLHVASCMVNPNSLKNFKEALLALNQVHPPHDAEEIEDILVMIPQWSRIVEPAVGSTNADTRMMDKLREEFEDYGREQLMELPGNILVPHNILMYYSYYLFNFASLVRREVYLILVEIVAELDWDPFLQLRAQTFFMENASESEDSESEDSEGGVVAVDIEEIQSASYTSGNQDEAKPELDVADSNPGSAEIEEQEETHQEEGEERKEDENSATKAASKLSVLNGKEVCCVWLDEMMLALYSDLSEYVEFKLHVKNIKKTINNDFEVAGNYDTELDDDEECDTDEEVNAVSFFSGPSIAADWFRRGILAERILRLDEAERSHRAAMNSQFKMVSSLTLLRMYSETLQLKQACKLASRILRELHPDAPRDPVKWMDFPYAIQDAYFHMISRAGLQAVRKAQQQVGGKSPAAITEIFHQAVEWHIAGFAH